MMTDIKILGIETSCDETSAAVVADGRRVLSNVIASSAQYQAQFGGVVPEVAARKHIENISQVVDCALEQAGITIRELSAIAATNGPGLIGALLVGLNYGKALAYGADLPFVAVHHIQGHIASNFLESHVAPPFLCLVVSGGHTMLINVVDYHTYNILGSTQDDAVGEAYDKVARLLKLPYPGGPALDALAKEGVPNIPFPMAFANQGLDFSYSGLKSAVINYINTKTMKNEEIVNKDIAASFQKAAIDVLIKKTAVAIKQTKATTLTVCGGVACNSLLRNKIQSLAEELGIDYHIPKPVFCTDNGAMIAALGYYKFLQGELSPLNTNAHAVISL
ncbi:MAG: tRNA (adenosine(37)-N6)-threonylcarbamoyltransferase complex transferase subunit TsaD [Defluviitaleaceae bacterium]|nr:tRNA (adenosine(37)-N6)-threonylcarbamoyltransferase complex transferase subunit TsaD [Defluviitaleaceae bacterium]